MSLIEVHSLIKRYGNNLAVDSLNLNINEGEIFGLLGPNGAGKSTTIKMLLGLIKSNGGKILIKGLDITKNPLEAKKLMGLVPQDIAIYESLSALDNIKFFGSLYNLKGEDLKRKANKALEFVGLLDKAKEKPKTFSGGMRRRLNIACAIVHEPKIVIMDEPTVGIDPQSRNHILEAVKKLNRQGSTIIYTSHYMEEVEVLCDRLGIMDHGKLIVSGEKNEIKKLSKIDEIISIEATDIRFNPIDELKKLPGVRNVILDGNTIKIIADNGQSVLQDALFILSNGDVRVKNIALKEPDLESVFLSLTGRSLRD